jgi:hypothetical protein
MQYVGKHSEDSLRTSESLPFPHTAGVSRPRSDRWLLRRRSKEELSFRGFLCIGGAFYSTNVRQNAVMMTAQCTGGSSIAAGLSNERVIAGIIGSSKNSSSD